MPKAQIINPINYPGWDDLLATNPESTFFHSAAWAETLSKSYNYKPLYFTRIDNNKLTGLIAVMEVSSILTGKRGVSLPFTDQCEPLAADNGHFNELLASVLEHGKKSGWQYLQLRGGAQYLKDKAPSETFFNHELNLNASEDEIFSNFRSSTRRNIKKAQKQDVAIEKLYSLEAVKTFYRLNCMTRRDHGLPPQPYIFFKNLYDYVISRKKGCILLAVHQGKTIAGAVYLRNSLKAIYKYGASDKKYQYLRANNLVMGEAIKGCAADGLKTFDFGRTEPEHAGLLQFKRGWGAKEKKAHYFHYDFKENGFIKKTANVKSSYTVFNKLPIFVLKLIGRLAYRHVT